MKKGWFAGWVLAMGWTGVAGATDAPHTYECRVCHDIHNALGAVGLSQFSTNVSLCQSCHQPGGDAERFVITGQTGATPGVSGTTHRFNVNSVNPTWEAVKPTHPEVRARLEHNPSFPDSAVVCSTCHDQHSQAVVPFLRVEADSLCGACHTTRGQRAVTANANIRRRGDQCGDCHNMQVPDTVWGSHPVRAVLPASSDFRHPPGLPVFGDTVKCISCHSVHYGYSTRSIKGVASSGTRVSLTDNAANWTPNQFVGWEVWILDRTGTDTLKWYQYRTVQSNTSTTLNWDPDSLAFPVEPGDTFLLKQPGPGDGNLLYVSMDSICTQCHVFTGNGIHLDAANGALWPGGGVYGTRYAHLSSPGSDTLLSPRDTSWGVFNQPLPASLRGSCYNCHWVHGWANNPSDTAFPYMLVAEPDSVCAVCHDADGPASPVYEVEATKPYTHHGVCVACHNTHKAEAGTMNQPGSAPTVNPELYGVPGVDVDSTVVDSATKQYQVCLGCHETIRRELFSAVSYHPVHKPGAYDGAMPTLYNGWTENDLVYCTDCHNNNTGTQNGGTDPAGPHGSDYPRLLERQYVTTDPNAFSTADYALCFKCHDPNVLVSRMGDGVQRIHWLHLWRERAACATCHNNPHRSDGPHLITFNPAVVDTSPSTGLLLFQDDGYRQGTCYLTCHGEDHNPETY